MKKTIFIILLAVIVIGSLVAQALSVDSRKVPIQMADNFALTRITCTADTIYRRVTVPANAVEAWVIAETGAFHVNPDSLYSEAAGLKRYVSIPAAAAFTLPVRNHTKFYIRRAAAGTGSTVNIIWKKI